MVTLSSETCGHGVVILASRVADMESVCATGTVLGNVDWQAPGAVPVMMG